MSFRNRTCLAGADGLLRLSVPLEDARNERQLYKEVKIVRGTWPRDHFRAITSCYNRSPWFEYYRDEMAELFRREDEYLWDWNLACFSWVNQKLGNPIGVEVKHIPGMEGGLQQVNCVDYFLPSRQQQWEMEMEKEKPVRYPQVFEERTGFISGLSILDLLFCEGPAALGKLA